MLVFIIKLSVMRLAALVEETASFREFLYGSAPTCSYDNWISHVSEGIALEDYNLYSPWDVQTNGFGDFHIADSEELDSWGSIIDAFLDGSYALAQALIDDAGFPYEVVQFEDTDTNRTYYLLRELLNPDYYDDNGTAYTGDDEAGSFDYGWGLYVHYPEAANSIIVTVPHPNDDFIAPPVSYECFVSWDAMFLLISGAGREVKWTEQGTYNNSKSLSDPSRVLEHAFNVAYQKFCSHIRLLFGRRELSTQIHSYDWNRHQGHPSCQISAGAGKNNPNLPIRDLADARNDIINNSDYLVLAPNSIGIHSPVYLDDYYSVNYSLYEFWYDRDGKRHPVSNHIDLPGYGQNRQMLHTCFGWNDYDVFEPFFHIEMDELPNCYEENEDNYRLYYSYDQALGQFNMAELFTKPLAFNSHWIEAMVQTLPLAISLDDGIPPQTPQNLQISQVNHNSLSLKWSHVSSSDFYTYEIRYALTPITGTNYSSANRSNNSLLADQRRENLTLYSLGQNTQYFLQICSIDYNGDVSEVSDEISVYTAPTYIINPVAVGGDRSATLLWIAGIQSGNMGFNVYRQEEEELIQVGTWQNDPTLAGAPLPGKRYSYSVSPLPNSQLFSFQLSCVNEQGTEYFLPQIFNCQTNNIFDLVVSEPSGNIADTVSFGMNFYASHGYDTYFDLKKNFFDQPQYIHVSFYQQSWAPGGMHLDQIIFGNFNPKSSSMSSYLKISTNQLNQYLQISLDADFQKSWSKLYLIDPVTEQIVNLVNGNFYYIAESTAEKMFQIIWGNYIPGVNIASMPNSIYQGGSLFTLNWFSSNHDLIEYQRIFAVNETDTLIIADHLNRFVKSYKWTVPEDLEMQNTKIGIDILTTEGKVLRTLSNFTVGFVPAITTLSTAPGWHLVSNPWLEEPAAGIEEIFGPGATLITPSANNQYVETTDFKFGQGYWLHSPAGSEYTSDLNLMSSSHYAPLQPGWNLVANPHACSYEIKDLKFRYNGITRNFYTLNNMSIIPKILVGYNNGGYEIIETIPPYQSFYLYANVLPEDNIECLFTPYTNTNYSAPAETWSVKIKAIQLDSEEIILGVAPQTSENFDFSLDLPHPPSKPFQEGISLYISKTGSPQFLYDQLSQEFKSALRPDVPDTVRWDFSLAASPFATVTLEFNLNLMPKNYRASINIADNSWCNLVNNVYVYAFTPGQLAVNNGYLEITNNFNSATDRLPLVMEFNNFPNPFNPSTKIEFSLTRATRTQLAIFNIKGQMITILADSELEAGRYTYVWEGKSADNKPSASGIYLIQLKTEDEILIRKSLLLK